MKHEVIRFLITGATNTALGYLIYLAFLLVLPYTAAYSISYVIGIFVSYALNTAFVFKERWSWKRFAAFPLVYVVQYLLGLALLALLVEKAGVPKTLAPLVIVIIILPVTFFLSRFVIRGKRP